MTLLDALQYLSLFPNKKTKAYKCTKKQISTGKVYESKESIKKQPKQGIKRMKKKKRNTRVSR